MRHNRKPTEAEIKSLQSFYDEGNSMRKIYSEFGWSRRVCIKYLKTRQPENISDEERRKRKVNRVVNWRQRAKRKLVESKGGKCEMCGYDKCIDNLTFHHIDPSKKDFQIGGMSVSYDRLLVEIAKCKMLCRNCHGEVHAIKVPFIPV